MGELSRDEGQRTGGLTEAVTKQSRKNESVGRVAKIGSVIRPQYSRMRLLATKPPSTATMVLVAIRSAL